MTRTGQVPMKIASREALLSLAHALECEAAARYRDLARLMLQQGNQTLAAEFDTLAKIEDLHATEVEERGQDLLGHALDPTMTKWELPLAADASEVQGATFSPYQALAFAVRNEERAFAFYSYVAAEAEDAGIRMLAEQLASDELNHAAMLRLIRRKAFHADRPVAIDIPEDLEALRLVTRRWMAEAAQAHAQLAEALDRDSQHAEAALFHRIATEENAIAAGFNATPLSPLRNAADGSRLLEQIFDRYALIGERSSDERVVAEAQRSAAEIVAHLALASGSRDNSLLA